MSSPAPPPEGGAGPPRWDGGAGPPPADSPPRWDTGSGSGAQHPGGDELWQRPEGWQPPETADVPRRKIGRSVWVLAGLALVLVAALIAWRLWPSSEGDAEEVAQEFLDAAIAGDCARAEELSTGDVNSQVGTLCGQQGSQFGTLLGDADPTVEVDEVDGDEATATAALSIASFSLQLEMSMVNEDGRWLVSELTLPGGLPEELLGELTP